MTGHPCEIGILFADVVGSTRLYETLGDRAALAIVGDLLREVAAAVAEAGGIVVKTIGDEVMARFDGPADMVAAAVAMQVRVDALPPVAGPRGTIRLCLRVGLHHGPAIAEAADVFGDTVNVAARMTGLAGAGQIITTGATCARLPAAQREATRLLHALAVKGRAEPVDVVEIVWQATPELTQLNLLRLGAAAPARSRLRLKHGQHAWVFDADQTAIALGREPSSEVVILDQQASRRHATIERRRDRWLLVDHSTNGTFVTFAGQAEFQLHREEVILSPAGLLSFGHPFEEAGFDLRFALL